MSLVNFEMDTVERTEGDASRQYRVVAPARKILCTFLQLKNSRSESYREPKSLNLSTAWLKQREIVPALTCTETCEGCKRRHMVP